MGSDSSGGLPLGLDPIVRFVDRLSTLAGWLAALALVALFSLMLSEVFARNLLGTSIPIAWDYAAYMMGATFFLAAASALRHDVHVRVTLLGETLPKKVAKNVDVLATVLAFAIASYLCFALGDQAYQSFKRGAKSFSVVATPLWIPQLVLLIGGVIFALQLLARAIRVAVGADGAATRKDRI